jgi:dsDNA-specific endonuclease/ATPase MutS2
LTSEKILEVENLLQSLSDELLKLKSATKQYEETKDNLQKMCESIDKISLTHQKLTDNMSQFLAEMEKVNLEGEKTRECIKSTNAEAKSFFEEEAHKYQTAAEASLSKKYNELSDEFKKQGDRILQENISQSKALRFTRSLILLGIVIEAVIIARLFLI